ncbi:MAG: IS21 family transposase [Candidatus Omnitrophica bacterium]|nr:IS21 family transposase [Candidatus Omnitrophota bacterium]
MQEAMPAGRQESLIQRVLHLNQVEKLSQRQIAEKLNIGRKRIRRILNGSKAAKPIPRKSILDDYIHLISYWYKEYPRLKANQVYERLKPYGYQGSYVSVARLSRQYRKIKPKVYHTLTFVPGEEAQVDWFFFNHEKLGQVAGFLYVLSYSRYAWGIFYPKTSLEFFMAGHLVCFEHIGGLAHRHRYDNVKTVVLSRHPTIQYNPQFLDFSRFYNFSIYLCNPYKGNEKGRVERIIRDIRPFLYAEDFADLNDLNRKFHAWLTKRNNTVHRTTAKTPKDLLSKERLIALPENVYLPRRIIPAAASKTALVEFETNKYSVPVTCAVKVVEVMAYPERIEICVSGEKVATHRRCFAKKKLIQNPLHAEKLLNRTPRFKMQRILQLIVNMDSTFKNFILFQDNDDHRIQAAYQLFQLLKTHSKSMLVSAVRELNSMKCFKIKALRSLLNLPEPKQGDPLWPQNIQLLNLTYEERNLNDYDPHSEDMEPT